MHVLVGERAGADRLPAGLGNVILVCISSAKLTEGRPTITPLALNGNGPLNVAWKFMMPFLLVHDRLVGGLRASAVIPVAWEW